MVGREACRVWAGRGGVRRGQDNQGCVEWQRRNQAVLSRSGVQVIGQQGVKHFVHPQSVTERHTLPT